MVHPPQDRTARETVKTTDNGDGTFTHTIEAADLVYLVNWMMETGKRRFEMETESEGHETRARFETYRNAAGEYAWRFVAGNGEVMAQGEGYTSAENCDHAIEVFRREAPFARIVEIES